MNKKQERYIETIVDSYRAVAKWCFCLMEIVVVFCLFSYFIEINGNPLLIFIVLFGLIGGFYRKGLM